MPEEVQWGPAVLVLLAGLVLGTVLVWRLRKRASGPAPALTAAPTAEPHDPDEKLERLVLQLRELDDTADKRTADELARERYALELEAARALEARERMAVSESARDTQAQAAVATAGDARGPLAARPAMRGFLWGAGTVGAVALLVVMVSRAAKPRAEGGGATGETPGETASRSGEAPLADAQDVEARLDRARQLLGERDLMGVWNETQAVLARVPGHPRALSYQALVRLAMGQGEIAERMLKQAVATDPDLLEARQHLAFVYTQLGRRTEAEATIAEISRRFPGEGERLRQALAGLDDEAGGAADPSADEDPHAGVGPPAGTGATADGGEARGASVAGVIDADGAVRARIPPGTPIFVTVRTAGVEQGPPVAVKRLVASRFPLPFAVGPADSMMGQPLPDRMRLDVRADSDGDPMTRPPSDPKAGLDGVKAGSTDLRIALR